VVEDDSERGFGDERLVYTVFLSDKQDDPTRRGRMGRGLKELIAAMDAAVVETVGTTIEFDAQGRRSRPNERKRGTRIELRAPSPPQISKRSRTSSLVVPPKAPRLSPAAQCAARA
jgi:hypothetical protein